MFSDISSAALNSSTPHESITSEMPCSDESYVNDNSQSYDTQIANYRYRNHWIFIDEKRNRARITEESNRKKANYEKNVNSYLQPNNGQGVGKQKDTNRIATAIERIKTLKRLTEENTAIEDVHKWPRNTILIAGDSMLSNLDERRLGINSNVKVRSFSGSTISDMYFYLHPLLQKQPEYVILHVGHK